MIQSKEDIIAGLEDRIHDLRSLFDDMDEQIFLFNPPNRWTSGQHLSHLILTTKPVSSALKVPKMALKLKFGLTNRPCRTYDYVLNKYNTGIAGGYSAVESVQPDDVSYNQKSDLITELIKHIKRIIKSTNKWKEADLDKYILPHPAMGKMPIREILFFTEFHLLHHINILKNQYIK